MAHLKGVVRFKNDNGKEVINVEGVIYQEVDRRAREGDVILLGIVDDPWFKNHKFYVVLDVNCDGGFIVRDEGGDQSYIEWHDIERVYEKLQKVSEEKPAKFKAGDKAVVIADTDSDRHGQPLGIIVKIRKLRDDKRYQAITPSKGSWAFAEEDLRPATESDLKWAELGRKVGELKDGDVVRFLEDTGTGRYPKGSLAVISSVRPMSISFVFEFGDAVSKYRGISDWVELVAPAESIVNLKA